MDDEIINSEPASTQTSQTIPEPIQQVIESQVWGGVPIHNTENSLENKGLSDSSLSTRSGKIGE